MATAQVRPQTAPAPGAAPDGLGPQVPPLESGDHLTRAEFERRYAAMPELKKAELIEGVVYVGSPVHVTVHGEPHSLVIAWLGTYCAATPGVRVADNTTVRLDLENEPQPDVFVRLEPEAGGRSRVSDDGYLEGPPELVVVVAASSASIDRHTKLRVYRRNGVPEYLVWSVLDRRPEWFVLRDGDYVPLAPDERGVTHSQVLPGLRLAVTALLSGDPREGATSALAAVLAEEQAAFTAAEHRQFVETGEDLWRRYGWSDQALAPEQLYDLVFDPQERCNLAGEPRHVEALAEMRARLDRWMRATDDPLLRGPIPAPPGARILSPEAVSPRELARGTPGGQE